MHTNRPVPRIAFTPGEPSGIGPDLCVKFAQQSHRCEIVAIINPKLLEQRAEQLGLPLFIKAYSPEEPAEMQEAGVITVLPVALAGQVKCGELNQQNARYVIKAITRAVRGCLEGVFDAMVTGPVQKSVINDAGIAFSGHTEFIANISGGHPVMMLATPGLRVALVTTHIPLSAVSQAVTHNRLRTVIRLLHQELQAKFGIAKPHILVCGLNPHAGENGHLGREEIEVMEPVLKGLRKQGLLLHGPIPADTIFTEKNLANADVVLTMYHDQGLPVLKYMGFGQAVNITLGLPIIRTSVDHGTALDLAGTGTADTGSLEYAVQCALEIVANKVTN
jgi:4-hydroxythreonine-4-phosphate dehydrogenase